jgi:uncharacterized protein (TIGR03382 family)
MRRWTLLVGLWLLASCGGSDFSLGLTGCDGPQPPFETTAVNTVAGAVHGTLTSAGTDFLIEHRETLVGLLLDVDANGHVALDLPAFDFGDQGFGLGVGVRDLRMGFDLRTADMAVQFLPDPTRLRVEVLHARLSLVEGIVWMTVGGDAACRLGDGLAPNTPDSALIDVDFVIDIELAVDAEGRLVVGVEVLPFTVHALDFTLIYDRDLPECADGITALECRLACGAGEGAAELGEALYSAFDAQLNQLLTPLIEQLVAFIVDDFTEQPLAAEGALHPRIIAALLPTAFDSHPIGYKVGPSPEGLTVRSSALAHGSDGLGLTMDVGLDAIDHPCVPPMNAPPPLVAGPAPVLSGYDHQGQPYHLGLSLSDASVNRAVWVAYRGGALCAALDSDQIEALTGQYLDTGALALVLPGLSELTLGARPIRVALDPVFEPGDQPFTRFMPIEDDGGIPQAGIHLSLPRLGLSFYGLVEERWTRLFAAEVTVELDVVVQATPDDRLILAVAQPQIGALTETYNELLSGADVPGLLALIADLLASSVLQDGLQLDLGLAGLLSAFTGLPLDARIAALRVEGGNADFLSVLLSLRTLPEGAGVAPSTETTAWLLGVEPGRVTLHVEASAAAARYQWRLDAGPWRPLQRVDGSTLIIESPGLWVLGDHRVAVRAVTEGDYRSLDPTPAEVAVRVQPLVAEPVAAAPEAQPASGCATSADGAPGLWGLLLMVGLLLRRRWLLLLLPLVGCDDRPPAARIQCDTTAECPAGLSCVEGACVRPDRCDSREDCCPGAECRGGICVAPEPVCSADVPCGGAAQSCVAGQCLRRACADSSVCPAAHHCLGGYCHREPPCRAACGLDGACFAVVDACRPAPPSCDQSCPAGSVRVVQDPEAYLGAICDLSSATCGCAEAPALIPADFGRYASMGLLRGEPVFAAWDADYGDLVYVTGVEAGAPQVTYLDGVPPDAPVVADAAGPRGGRAEPGPDRGRYASLAIDGKGRPHIAYYDAEQGDLRYIRGRVDGGWIPPVVVDAAGDVGRYAVIGVNTLNQPHILYHVTEGPDGRAGVRLAYNNGDAVDAAQWSVETLLSRALTSPAPPVGETPASPGVMPCMQIGVDGQVYAAWYDGEQGWPYVARGRPGAQRWIIHPLSGTRSPVWPPDPGGRYDTFEDHDLGRFCDIAYDPGSDGVFAVFADDTTNALVLYQGPVAGGGVFELVDPGGRGVRRLVGADPALALDADGRPLVAYQDATDNNVLLAVRGPQGWAPVPTRAIADGAVGFYNSLVVVGDEAIIGTLELRTRSDGRGDHRLRVARLPVPDF